VAKTLKPPLTLGDFPKWKKGDGPVKYVWKDKPEGHRCGWSCVWATGNGQVKPRDWDIERLSWKQLYYELQDLAHMKHMRQNDARDMLDLVSVSSAGQFLPQAKRLLHEARELYPHYQAPWNMPGEEKIFKINYRPGWGG